MTGPLPHLTEAPLGEAARGRRTYETSTRGRVPQGREEGLEFPHLYGTLPVGAVVEVRPWYGARREEDGPQ
ncbi:hypothetical protein [Streptomyces sp. NPDC007346]|uniref:hypothetical protein n=1 Tax=Streptomyces sp. NPDC007346 TaxID=3154682 RepID=UPI0034552EA3